MKWGRTMLTEIKWADIHSGTAGRSACCRHCIPTPPVGAAPRVALAIHPIFPNKQALKCISILNQLQLKSDPLNQFKSHGFLVDFTWGNTTGLWLKILQHYCLPRLPIFQTKDNFNIGNSGNSSWGGIFLTWRLEPCRSDSWQLLLALAGLQMAAGPTAQPTASAHPAGMSSHTSWSITPAAGSIEPIYHSRDPTEPGSS